MARVTSLLHCSSLCWFGSRSTVRTRSHPLVAPVALSSSESKRWEMHGTADACRNVVSAEQANKASERASGKQSKREERKADGKGQSDDAARQNEQKSNTDSAVTTEEEKKRKPIARMFAQGSRLVQSVQHCSNVAVHAVCPIQVRPTLKHTPNRCRYASNARGGVSAALGALYQVFSSELHRHAVTADLRQSPASHHPEKNGETRGSATHVRGTQQATAVRWLGAIGCLERSRQKEGARRACVVDVARFFG
jgi:hypothetical protein